MFCGVNPDKVFVHIIMEVGSVLMRRVPLRLSVYLVHKPVKNERLHVRDPEKGSHLFIMQLSRTLYLSCRLNDQVVSGVNPSVSGGGRGWH